MTITVSRPASPVALILDHSLLDPERILARQAAVLAARRGLAPELAKAIAVLAFDPGRRR